MTDTQRMIIRRTFRRSTEAAEPGWHADDPDDEDNMTFTPLVTEPSPERHDPQSRLDDFADRLEDRTSQDIIDEQRRMDAQRQRVMDIDRLMAEKQGLTGTLDPYIDPKGVLKRREAELKPFRDRYDWLLNVASLWGLTVNGYKFPKDKPDEDVQDYLDRMKADLDRRILHKQKYGW